MENLVSIIIPIYKVEKYLKKCIESVRNQTYTNIEIILVDDGSPDNCGKICDEYEKEDNRIKVIHKENGGLSDARNKGIDISKGEYITFIDSDDYVSVEYVKKLYEAIKKNNSLVSQCNIQIVDEEENEIQKIGKKETMLRNGNDMIKSVSYGEWNNTVVWNKMYNKKIFENIRFPKGKIHEDEFTTYKILYNKKSITTIPEYLYYYRQSTQSITGKKFNINRLDILEALRERVKFFEEKHEKELYDLAIQELLGEIRKCHINVKRYLKEEKELEEKLLKEYRENYTKVKKCDNIRLSKRVKIITYNYIPNIYYLIYVIIKRKN